MALIGRPVCDPREGLAAMEAFSKKIKKITFLTKTKILIKVSLFVNGYRGNRINKMLIKICQYHYRGSHGINFIN